MAGCTPCHTTGTHLLGAFAAFCPRFARPPPSSTEAVDATSPNTRFARGGGDGERMYRFLLRRGRWLGPALGPETEGAGVQDATPTRAESLRKHDEGENAGRDESEFATLGPASPNARFARGGGAEACIPGLLALDLLRRSRFRWSGSGR
jgi:hypothetical protein